MVSGGWPAVFYLVLPSDFQTVGGPRSRDTTTKGNFWKQSPKAYCLVLFL
jgi:hypothetical protein